MGCWWRNLKTAANPQSHELRVSEIKEIRDKLDALQRYAKRSGKFTGADYYDFAEPKVKAEWKGGRLLRGVAVIPRIDNLDPNSEPQKSAGRVAAINASGLKLDTAYCWIDMSYVEEPDLEAYFAARAGRFGSAARPPLAIRKKCLVVEVSLKRLWWSKMVQAISYFCR